MTSLYSAAIPQEGGDFLPEEQIGGNPPDEPGAGDQNKGILGPNIKAELQDFQDHFSLPSSSSTVRFRKTQTLNRIYPSDDSQFVIRDDYDEDTGERQVFAMKLNDSTSSLRMLRLSYTLVCAFWTGFLFVLSLQILLFLILDLTIEIGATSKGNLRFGRFLGTLLALPMLVHALASAMVIAGHYIVDTWNGHSLVKRFIFGRFNQVLVEWMSFAVFLGIPLFVLCITLCMKLKNFWEITSLAWFSCVCIFYIIFACAVVYSENRACLETMANRYQNDNDALPNVLARAIRLRQAHVYSGTTTSVYLTEGAIDDGAGLKNAAHKREEPHRLHKSPYAHLVVGFVKLTGGAGLFQELAEPVRQYTYDDALGVRPFITATTWSLEKIYCRPHNSRYVAVIEGRDRLTEAQIRSTIICSLLGNCLVIFLLTAVLVWQGLPRNAVALIVIVVFLFAILPALRNTYRIYAMSNDLKAQWEKFGKTITNEIKELFEGEDKPDEETPDAAAPAPVPASSDMVTESEPVSSSRATTLRDTRGQIIGDSQAIYQVWELHRTHEPTELLCWLIFVVEVVIFFLYPTISLYIIGNWAIATLYLFMVAFTGLRTYVNAAVVLEEVGSLDLVDGEKGTPAYWQAQSRVSTIVENITRSRARSSWAAILWIFLLALLGLFAIALNQSAATASNFQFTYLPDFYYEQQEDLLYPTCTVGKGLAALGSPSTSIADYAFLAALAYRTTNITQGQLDSWFGNGTAEDQFEVVDNFRERTDNFTSAVVYKFIRFPASQLGVVSIRGTINAWDALTDAQLWSAAAVFQALRFLLPMGELWNPILHRLDEVVSALESATINRVAFYKQTTEFTNYLKTNTTFKNLQVTGHSLGGGLAIITGAQTGVAAVALSGPNALISRSTFSPPLTVEALNTKTFNIVPDRDVVPRIDDVAQLHQNIRCTAPTGDFIGCHDGRRSLCEILYSCGTGNRPALCECVTLFGYPEPKPGPNATMTFKQACGL